jgi:xylose isomerase
MQAEKLSRKIAEIEKLVEDESLGDGLTILSATLSHAIALSIESGNFDAAKLHHFLEEMEKRILSSVGHQPKISGIKRAA